MPYIKVYIHLVWSTKNRVQYLDSKDLRLLVWTHIRENARQKGIFIDSVNGYSEHCHCLISLGANQTLQKVMQMIKGESSFWINKQKLTKQKFEWQEDYYAISVSKSMINKTRNYIKNQEEHHTKKSFSEEHEKLIVKYGFEVQKDLD